jgi:type II secretory pathway pseudopilin PulG
MNTYSNSKQQGFILVSTVVVVMVVMVLMSTYMVNLVGNQQVNTSLSQRSIQAWYAAHSGMQWAINDVQYHNANHLNCGQVAPTFTLTGGGTRGFTVTVNCVATNMIDDDNNNYTVYVLKVRAFQGMINRSNYVTRTIRQTTRIRAS